MRVPPCPHGPAHVLSGEMSLPGSHVVQASHLRRKTSRGVWVDAQTQTEVTGSVRSPLGVKGAWQERDAVALGQGSRLPSNGLTTAALGGSAFSRDILPFAWQHERLARFLRDRATPPTPFPGALGHVGGFRVSCFQPHFSELPGSFRKKCFASYHWHSGI